ncbi:aldose 1-epimerase family protein [Oricola thermophila]|uniref:Aldose 1-epimerase family protein n=1 Tax=Oricola thermophila TaxID=2742145 RepID=A0A6N1VB73_9HYPH|nr:aldose 1-epimerase family protein [Oricola thermophila]QKV17918.1 aldose 1-epimerase family protein [Oricola thermophila]
MSTAGSETKLHLSPDFFPATGERTLVENHAFRITTFRYPSSVEGLRIENARGRVTILPWLGQMIWEAVFDGRNLGMGNEFPYPRHGDSILSTYGAFAYHAGVLRNGTPGPEDTHPLHGEMPVQRMDSAHLVFGGSGDDAYVTVGGHVEYVMGFGPHYVARPTVRLAANSGLLDVAMEVENLSAHPMELMYMLHANFDFVAGATIHQPAGYTPEATVVRQAIPGHVTPSQEFLALLEDLKTNPARMQTLDEPELYSPEQVFYIRGLKRDDTGRTRLAMELPDGDAFSVAYNPDDFPHCVRWILNDGDAQVAAFALPSTCEPEGYTAEKAKGHVRMLASGETVRFPVHLGYLDRSEAAAAIADIKTFRKD